jgi:AraC-like DNA-binding protein
MISVIEGDVSVMIEGREYRVSSDKTLILPPLIYHTVTANKRGRYIRVTALFDAWAIPEVLRDSFGTSEAAFVISCPYQSRSLEKICKSEKSYFYAPLADSIMTEIFYECVKNVGAESEGEIDETLEKMLAYIDSHLFEKITLDAISRHVARSDSYVSHTFAEKMGTTPKQYILSKKLALAEKYIIGGMPVTEAALRIGYDNYSDFYRIYRKHRGISPSCARETK